LADPTATAVRLRIVPGPEPADKRYLVACLSGDVSPRGKCEQIRSG
jgi:hypothetical protein